MYRLYCHTVWMPKTAASVAVGREVVDDLHDLPSDGANFNDLNAA